MRCLALLLIFVLFVSPAPGCVLTATVDNALHRAFGERVLLEPQAAWVAGDREIAVAFAYFGPEPPPSCGGVLPFVSLVARAPAAPRPAIARYRVDGPVAVLIDVTSVEEVLAPPAAHAKLLEAIHRIDLLPARVPPGSAARAAGTVISLALFPPLMLADLGLTPLYAAWLAIAGI